MKCHSPAALGLLQLVHRQRVKELVGNVHRGRPRCRDFLQAAVPPHLYLNISYSWQGMAWHSAVLLLVGRTSTSISPRLQCQHTCTIQLQLTSAGLE